MGTRAPGDRVLRGGEDTSEGLAVLLAILLAVGAGVHGTLVPEHARESVVVGLGFAVVGALQLAAAILVLLRPSRRLMMAIAAGSVGAILAWAASRLVGLPFGPRAWEPESLGVVDGVTALFEAAAAGAAILAASGRNRAGERVVAAAGWTCGALGAALLSLAGAHASGHRVDGGGAGHLGGHLVHAALVLAVVLTIPLVHGAVARRQLGRGGGVDQSSITEGRA